MAEQNEYEVPEQQHWRNEVASRLRQHRARRRGDKGEVSMELDFPAPLPSPAETPTQPVRRLPKIIRFPSSEPEPDRSARMPFEVAEDHSWQNLPMDSPDVPRIFEANQAVEHDDTTAVVTTPTLTRPAEQMELLPSFDDIQLDASEHRQAIQPESCAHVAPLQLRAIAAGVDTGLVFLGALIFALTFREVAEGFPHVKLASLFAIAVVGALWMLYQYLFLVHSRGTPGMRLSQLELTTFEGKPASALHRRCRALACGLSAGSLGLGYGWALIDEDQLAWHDRMTQTLLRECCDKETPEAQF
jgi:uncharacterized RDD family membrane protein YckC